MVGDDLHPRAHGQGSRLTLANPAQPTVLFGELLNDPSGIPDDESIPTELVAAGPNTHRVRPEGLTPGVDAPPVRGGAADNGRRDPNSGRGLGRDAKSDLADVVDRIDPGPHLGDSGHRHDGADGGRAAERYMLERDARRPDALSNADHCLGSLARASLQIGRIRGGIRGPLVRVDANEFNAGQCGDLLSDGQSVLGCDTLSPEARVDSEHDAQAPPGIGEDRAERFGTLDGIGSHGQFDPVGEAERPQRLLPPNDGECNNDARGSGVGECFGLAELGHAQAICTPLQLEGPEGWHAVGLGVREQLDPVGCCERNHLVEVLLKHLAINEEGGGSCLGAGPYGHNTSVTTFAFSVGPPNAQLTHRKAPDNCQRIFHMAEGPKILIVDDEPNIRDLLTTSLRFAGFAVRAVGNGAQAISAVLEEEPDLIILDVMLPDMNGFGVTKRLRASGYTAPILFLTAKDDTEDKITGLTVGGDDYVTKPFSLDEIVARIKAILRRTMQDDEEAIIRAGEITMDQDTHEVTVGNEQVELSPTEFKLLRYLMLNPNRVLSKAQILDHVWEYDFNGDAGIVESYISYLRRKLDQYTEEPVIQTKRGFGYMLKAAK